jgi:YaaC-like Protein
MWQCGLIPERPYGKSLCRRCRITLVQMGVRPPITFFESSENLRSAVRNRTGRSLSSGAARDATICLQQGRLFFDAAQESGLEIRPLQLFYGSLAFAKAVTLVAKNSRLATLPRSHGLRDITAPAARLADLSLQIRGVGTFQDFNDATAPEGRVHTNDASTNPVSIALPAANSDSLEGATMTLKDILGRLPLVQDLFVHTFREPALSAPITLSENSQNFWCIQGWQNEPVGTLDEACAVVDSWRDRFPVLRNWRVAWVSNSWGKSAIEFRNEECPRTPIHEQLKTTSPGSFESSLPAGERRPPQELLAGGSLSDNGLCSPVNGVYICQPALVYLGIFLLSSLVRYRPEIWIHAMTRGTSSERPPDDHTISLLESFLGFVPGLMQGVLLDYLFPNDTY